MLYFVEPLHVGGNFTKDSLDCNIGRTLIFILISAVLLSCSNHKHNKITKVEIAKDVKSISNKITEYSEKAQLDSFLSCYDNSPSFLHFSSDGKMRNYQEFKKVCTEYYTSLKEQKVITIQEKIHVIDTHLALLGWTGNIIAQFKNGDIRNMNNYSITNIFKKIDNKWKVIHSHESSLPPEIFKNNK